MILRPVLWDSMEQHSMKFLVDRDDILKLFHKTIVNVVF